MTPYSPEEAFERASEYLNEEGDLPEHAWYWMGLSQRSPADSLRVWDELLRLRAAHFAKLGKVAPPYEGVWI